jgi:hypothetical protein
MRYFKNYLFAREGIRPDQQAQRDSDTAGYDRAGKRQAQSDGDNLKQFFIENHPRRAAGRRTAGLSAYEQPAAPLF